MADPHHTVEIPLIPDGYSGLDLGGRRGNTYFFIEADHNSNLSSARWAERVKGYCLYYSSGMYTDRYKVESLRVLTVCPNRARVAKLKQLTERVAAELALPGLAAMFYYTTYRRARWPSFFTIPIWAVAGRADPQALISPPPAETAAPPETWYDILKAP